MAPNGSVICPCGKAIVIIRQGVGVCSFCQRTYAVEANWAPKAAPKPEARAGA
jgi:hypothetical protein